MQTAPPQQNERFSDTAELLEAIEDGTFSERVGSSRIVEVVTLPPRVTVEFVRGTGIPEDQAEELQELAARLKANHRVEVDLIGCSDPSGSELVNLRISRDRAEAVAARLSELGVAEAQLDEVVGRGEACEVQERVVQAIPSLRREPTQHASEG